LSPTACDAFSGQPHAEVAAVLEPMLGAIMRMSGATAASVSALTDEGDTAEDIVAVGVPGPRGDASVLALARWCEFCAGSGTPAPADCIRSELCAAGERKAVDSPSALCAHIIAVPLRHRERPVGTLSLMFAAETALLPETTPLLQATGDLLGMTLDNARLARENVRISLTNERHLMANEVHDSLAQGLTYMRMRMSLLRDAIRHDDQLKAIKYCGDIDSTLGLSQRRLRELITCFRSRMDPQGLVHALWGLAAGFFERTGIALAFDNPVTDLKLPPEHEIEVFNIMQEALANVCRHAHAKNARIAIAASDAHYTFSVEDDGVGIGAYPSTPAQETGHYGIAIMHERARRLGGTVTIEPADPGTRLELRIPALQTHRENHT
jgi:two-component system nitrate/nitrite sensor histidine kinase NarX